MPPKTNSGASKKVEMKKKEKVIEDKTFGLKNKKGSKQQKFIQQVEHQVKFGGNKSARQLELEKESLKSKKDDKKNELAEITALFKPVQQLASKGADPKSVLCAFFKQGACGKGSKCKFSHDINVERKGEKRSAYVDGHGEGAEGDTMENWDEATLIDVVEQKHGKEKGRPTTEIICRYFLDAVENCKYGWFWQCPNSDSCIYKHALPHGFILKKDRKRIDKMDEISLEDLIERERAALGATTTRVTLVTFLTWKKNKIREREENARKDADKKKNDYKMGREHGLSGREMFTFDPDLATGEDDMEEGDESYDIRNMGRDGDDEEDQIEYKEIDFSSLMAEYQEVEGNSEAMSLADPDRLQLLRDQLGSETARRKTTELTLTNGTTDNSPVVGTDGAVGGAVAIDEELFDDDDLDDLEEELDELTLS